LTVAELIFPYSFCPTQMLTFPKKVRPGRPDRDSLFIW